MAFANAPMLQLVRGAAYLAGGLSDHTPLSMHIGLPSRLRGGSMEVESGLDRSGVGVFAGDTICI